LEFGNILQLRLASRHYRLWIDHLLGTSNFCVKYSQMKLHLKPEQIEKVSNLKHLFLRRHHIDKVLIQDLNKCPYVSTSFKFFDNKPYTYRTFGSYGNVFACEAISELLFKDDAVNVFAKVSRLQKLIPYFMLGSVNDDIAASMNKVQVNDNIEFVKGDLQFVGLLPTIMKVRATDTFDLFIRAYFMLVTIIGYVGDVEGIDLSTINKTICSCGDIYFIRRFIDLTFMVCKIDSPIINVVIQHMYISGYKDELTFSLQSLSPENRETIFKNCIKYDICKAYINNVRNAGVELIHLRISLEKALIIVNADAELNISDLTAAQAHMNQVFDNLKKSFEASALLYAKPL